MDANFTEGYENERPAHIQVLRFYTWIGMSLVMSWVIFGVQFGQLVTEGVLYPWHGVALALPFDLPRMAGLFWLVIAGVNATLDERRYNDGGDGVVSIWLMLFALTVIVCSGLLVVIGVWEHHLGTSLLVAAIVICGIMTAREADHRDWKMIWDCALLTAAGTGVWLGFIHGFAYGLLAMAVMRICPLPRPRQARSEREMLEAAHG